MIRFMVTWHEQNHFETLKLSLQEIVEAWIPDVADIANEC